MKAHNGSAARDQWKPPPGYVSAKAKAYAKWKEANGKPSKKVNMLRDDDANETDDDSSDEEGFRICCSVKSKRSKGPRIAPPPAPLITKNSFKLLTTMTSMVMESQPSETGRTRSLLENDPSQKPRG